MASEDCPFKVVRTNGSDEVLARAINPQIGRAAFETARRMFPKDLIEYRNLRKFCKNSRERVTVGCQSDILIWGTETLMRKLIFGVAAAAVFFAGVSPTFAAKKMGPSWRSDASSEPRPVDCLQCSGWPCCLPPSSPNQGRSKTNSLEPGHSSHSAGR
jgi:hypothetical protein